MWENPFEFKIKLPEISFAKLQKTIPIAMAESDSELFVKAELPGFSKDEIKINVTPNTASISAEKKKVRVERTEKMFKQEKSYGSVSRTVSLPVEAKTDGVKAKFENGVLEIILPKKEIKKKEERVVRVG